MIKVELETDIWLKLLATECSSQPDLSDYLLPKPPIDATDIMDSLISKLWTS